MSNYYNIRRGSFIPWKYSFFNTIPQHTDAIIPILATV